MMFLFFKKKIAVYKCMILSVALTYLNTQRTVQCTQHAAVVRGYECESAVVSVGATQLNLISKK